MLKWYAETFKFSGKELTPKALSRLKVLMFLSLPTYPLAVTAKIGQLHDNVNLLLNIILLLSGLCFIGFSLTKFINRFWSRDQYLDEWERAQKHEAMAFSFQVMMYTFAVFLILGGVFHRFEFARQIQFPSPDIYGVAAIFGSFFVLGLYVMHGYMLFTIKPMAEDRSENGAGLNTLI